MTRDTSISDQSEGVDSVLWIEVQHIVTLSTMELNSVHIVDAVIATLSIVQSDIKYCLSDITL